MTRMTDVNIELEDLPIQAITKYIEKAIDIAKEVMVDYDKQFQLQKAIFYINIELAKINETQAFNAHAIERARTELWEQERDEYKTNRSAAEGINKKLQEPIALHNLNQALIDKKITPMLEALIRIASAIKDERINQMSQAKIT